MELTPEAARLLRPDEPAVWVGKPDRTLWILSYIPSVLVMAAIATAFLLFFLPGMLRSDIPLLFVAVFGLAFLVPTAGGAIFTLAVGLFGHGRVLYVLTPRRVILQRGFIGRDFEIVDYSRVTDFTVEVGLWDKLFRRGTGTVRIFTASDAVDAKRGRRKELIHVPDAYDVQARMLRLLDEAKGQARAA